MSEHQDAGRTDDPQRALFFEESRKAFGAQYRAADTPSALVAQHMLDHLVDKGTISPKSALATIRNTASFAQLLLGEEVEFQKYYGRKIEDRISNIERNTDWRMAAAISLGTGLTFAVTGPFFNALLQPTVDELFKRPTSTPTATPSVPQPEQNTANNTYHFHFDTADAASNPGRPHGKLACKNATLETYGTSLAELLQQGNIVTLETQGKKVSLCYRPNIQRTAPQQSVLP